MTSNFSRYGGRLDLHRAVENRLLQVCTVRDNLPIRMIRTPCTSYTMLGFTNVPTIVCSDACASGVDLLGVSERIVENTVVRRCATHLAQVPKVWWRRSRSRRVGAPCLMRR